MRTTIGEYECGVDLRRFRFAIAPLSTDERDSERDANNKPIVARFGQNLTTLMARYCQGRVPRSCDHGTLSGNASRPCTLSESFVSSGDLVTLELRNTDTTVLR